MLYPLYIVTDSTGRERVRCVDLAQAWHHADQYGGGVALEPRQDESDLSPARRAEIDAIYAAGVAR